MFFAGKVNIKMVDFPAMWLIHRFPCVDTTKPSQKMTPPMIDHYKKSLVVAGSEHFGTIHSLFRFFFTHYRNEYVYDSITISLIISPDMPLSY